MKKVLVYLFTSLVFFLFLSFGDWEQFSVNKSLIFKIIISLGFGFLTNKIYWQLNSSPKSNDFED